MTQVITMKLAKEEAGEVSTRNSKMPGSSFAVSAKHCNVGAKLAEVKGSTCHKCYALRIQNMRPSVDMGWTANLDKAVALIARDPMRWARFMAAQIIRAAERTGEPYHRWFDAGDLQSLEMLEAIILVCEMTPHIHHWLPTREAAIVKRYKGTIPSNLVIRMSATMIGDAPIRGYAHTSTVIPKRHDGTGHGHVCPSRHQGNSCGQCRACWSRDVPNVAYPVH